MERRVLRTSKVSFWFMSLFSLGVLQQELSMKSENTADKMMYFMIFFNCFGFFVSRFAEFLRGQESFKNLLRETNRIAAKGQI